MARTWTNLDYIWNKNCLNLDLISTQFGLELDRNWTRSGLKLDLNKTKLKNGQKPQDNTRINTVLSLYQHFSQSKIKCELGWSSIKD